MRIVTATLLTALGAAAPQVTVPADKAITGPVQSGDGKRVEAVKKTPSPASTVPDVTLKRGTVDASREEPPRHEAAHTVQQSSGQAGEE